MKQIVYKGFSTLEILLAGAVFVVFSWSVIGILLTGLKTNRLGQETTLATEYATGGLEAVRSMKKNNFDTLESTSGTGLVKQDDEWIFEGTENVFDEKYTRVITVTAVNRNDSGDIVEDGGSEDPDTVRVTVTVSWETSPLQNDSVVLETYFTRWHL